MDPFSIGAAVNTTLTAIAKIFNVVKDYGTNYYKDSSLPEATKLTRVEPITVVSRDLLNNPEIQKILNVNLSLFCGYYLQAVDILTKVHDVEAIRILDKLNPDRDETGFLLSEKVSRESYRNISIEQMKFSLPTKSQPALEMDKTQKAETTEQAWERMVGVFAENAELAKKYGDAYAEVKALKAKMEEAAKDNKSAEVRAAELEYKKAQDSLVNSFKYEQAIEKVDLNTLANLSIGRLINVSIAYTKEQGQHAGEERFIKIPISVRLLVNTIPNESIVRIMTYKNQDLSLIERIHSANSGAIEFIRDVVFCQDLIDEYKRATIKDTSNILQELTRRANNAKKYGLLTKNPSLVAASSLFIISDAVAREVEQKLGGKLDNPRIREKAFDGTYSMIIAVVNSDWETVTFYTRGIARGATFGFRELESKGKGTGPDVGDILKALTAGQPPSF